MWNMHNRFNQYGREGRDFTNTEIKECLNTNALTKKTPFVQ